MCMLGLQTAQMAPSTHVHARCVLRSVEHVQLHAAKWLCCLGCQLLCCAPCGASGSEPLVECRARVMKWKRAADALWSMAPGCERACWHIETTDSCDCVALLV